MTMRFPRTMPILSRLTLTAALLLGSAPSWGAANHPARAATDRPRIARPGTVSAVQHWQFTSANTGESYDVQIYTPSAAAPKNGFPVIYVLDGGALFGAFMEAVRARSRAGELDFAVVVGIDGADGPKGADRFYDFSSSDFSAEEKTFVVDAAPNARHGGSELFFRTIEREIKPRVAALAPIDRSRATLFGWSLGGQFVLHTLFNHPDSYRTFEALSPSIWWNDRAILNEEPGFFERLSHGQTKPRIFIAAGGREQDAPIPVPGRDLALLTLEMRHARMVDNARDLARDLAAGDKDHRLVLASRIFDGETHNSVPWAALNTMLDFAIGPVLQH